jgi:hypothetical protein
MGWWEDANGPTEQVETGYTHHYHMTRAKGFALPEQLISPS